MGTESVAVARPPRAGRRSHCTRPAGPVRRPDAMLYRVLPVRQVRGQRIHEPVQSYALANDFVEVKIVVQFEEATYDCRKICQEDENRYGQPDTDRFTAIFRIIHEQY